MLNSTIMTRRHAAAAVAALSARLNAADSPGLKGRVNHSVCRWCYSAIPLEEFCKGAKEIGLTGIDLLGPAEWATAAKYGLTCAITTNPTIDGLGGIPKAFNRVEHHDKLIQAYEDLIPKEIGRAHV